MPSSEDQSIRTVLAYALLAPVVVLVVTVVVYVSFIAWVRFLIECLSTAQRWGWWP